MYIQDKSRMESGLKPCAGLWEALKLEPERCPVLCLAVENGQRKGVGQREYRILLNQADSESGLLLACETAACLRQMGERHCAVSGLYEGQRRFWQVETA